MCIRDSTWTTERKGELYLNTYTTEDKKITRKPVFMLDKILSMSYSADGRNMIFSGCLLYTSDAADERSSVDLGGRRIIKKKNHRAKGDNDKITQDKLV